MIEEEAMYRRIRQRISEIRPPAPTNRNYRCKHRSVYDTDVMLPLDCRDSRAVRQLSWHKAFRILPDLPYDTQLAPDSARRPPTVGRACSRRPDT